MTFSRTRPIGVDERGAVLVWVALMTVVLLGIGALAVDMGYAYATKRQLSNTADAAALAGAQEAGRAFKSSNGCGGTLDGLIRKAVSDTHADNPAAGTAAAPDVTIECRDAAGNLVNGTDATSVTVAVSESTTISTWFGKVLGADTLNPRATATAEVVGAEFQRGLRPFLVCLQDATEAAKVANKGKLYQSFYAKPDQGPASETAPSQSNVKWEAATERIVDNKAHGLSADQYIRLAIKSGADPAISGFYYVKTVLDKKGDPEPKEFQVSIEKGGPEVQISSDGIVDVYKLAPPLSGGNSLWGTDGVIQDPDAPLDLEPGTPVRINIVSGDGGVSDGAFVVTSAKGAPLTVAKGSGLPITKPTVALTVNVYALPKPAPCDSPTSPANWGYSAFDYKNGDKPQLACLIKYGYGGGDACPDEGAPGVNLGEELVAFPATGDNGNNLQSSSADDIRDLLGETILLPVGSGWNALGGGNAEYSGNGAVAVKLCGFFMPTNNNDTSYANAKEWDVWKGSASSPACGDVGQYDTSLNLGRVKDSSLVIQWIYQDDWVTSYIGQSVSQADQCKLWGATCVGALRLTK